MSEIFFQHFNPDNTCIVSLYSGSRTLSPVRVPVWLKETISAGAGGSGRVQLQRNLPGLHFVILFSFKMMLGLCFPDIRGSNERSGVTIPWGQQGFQQSLTLSDELRLQFGGAMSWVLLPLPLGILITILLASLLMVIPLIWAGPLNLLSILYTYHFL